MPERIAVQPPGEVADAPERAPARSASLVLELQRTVGNRTVVGLLARRTWDPAWGPTFHDDKAPRYDTYRGLIGAEGKDMPPAIRPASSYGGTPIAPVDMTMAELQGVIFAEGDTSAEEHQKRLDTALPNINRAFRIFGLDTVESQADYLGHTAGESGALADINTPQGLEERDAAKRDYAPFIGRGPVQVTGKENYIHSLAYVETVGEQLKHQALLDMTAGNEAKAKQEMADGQFAAQAAQAIKADIRQAAQPQYAFLFSAATMHWSKGISASARLKESEDFGGGTDADRWVSGKRSRYTDIRARAQAAGDTQTVNDMDSAIRRAKVKSATYGRAHGLLSKKKIP